MHRRTRALLTHIGRAYGLRVRKVSPCLTIYKREAAYRMETDRGTFMVKPFAAGERRLARIAAAIAGLNRKGFHHMPRWRTARNGKRWVRRNGKLYYVTRWISGSALDANERDFRRLGRALGLLHRRKARPAFRTVPGPSDDLAVLRRLDRQFRRHLRLAQRVDTPSGAWYREHGQLCCAWADEAWTLLRRREIRRMVAAEKKRPALIHGDVTLPNIIVADRIYFIDWDQMRGGSSYYELAKTLANTAHFSTPLMQALLAGYEESRPLGKAERLLISALFRLPREAWRECRYAARGKTSRLSRILRLTWAERTAAVAWLDEWAGRS